MTPIDCNFTTECTTTPCSAQEMCARTIETYTDNRDSSSKWSGGVPNSVYVQQRDISMSYSTCWCFPGDKDCSCGSASGLTADDGGVCRCDKIAPNAARCFDSSGQNGFGCSTLSNVENIVIFNGKEDLFVQWLAGFYLAVGENKESSGFAQFINYDNDQNIQAGHGLPFQAPAWM